MPEPTPTEHGPLWPPADLREIRVFLALAEELHFGRTADRLNVTHSSVSQTIRSLEAKLGGRLFDRTSRQVALTHLGEEFRERIAGPFGRLQRAYVDTRALTTGAVVGTLRLGVYAHPFAGSHLLEIIRSFEVEHPQCRVRITETGVTPDQFDWLRRDELDLLVMRMPFSDPAFQVGPVLAREERVLIVAKNHPLAARDSVSVEDLPDYTTTDVADAPREIMDTFSPPRTPSGKPIRRAHVRSVTEAAARAATGELVHPTVASYLDNYPHAGVTAVPIHDLPASAVALIWAKAHENAKILAFVAAASAVLDRDRDR